MQSAQLWDFFYDDYLIGLTLLGDRPVKREILLHTGGAYKMSILSCFTISTKRYSISVFYHAITHIQGALFYLMAGATTEALS